MRGFELIYYFSFRDFLPNICNKKFLKMSGSKVYAGIGLLLLLLIIPEQGYTQYCLRIKGANTYVCNSNPTAFQLNQFTIECWFRMEAAGVSVGTGGLTAIPLVTKGRAEQDNSVNDINYFLGIQLISDRLCADFEDGSMSPTPGKNHPLIGVTRIFKNVWYHAAMSLSSTSFSLYLNGKLEAQTSISNMPQSAGVQNFCIGSALNSLQEPAGNFIGSISEVRIWNVPRAATDISGNLFQRGLSASTLTARWSMNEQSGAAPGDSSGNGFNAALTGGAYSWEASSPFTDPLVLVREPFIQQNSPDRVTLAWRTNVPSNSFIRYSTNWQVLPDIATDESYATDHQLTLTDLIPGKKYYYQVGSTTKVLQRDTNNSFIMYPLADTGMSTFAWISGDIGTGSGVQTLVYNALKNYDGGRVPDVWINLGNQAYYSGSDNDYQTRFFNPFAGTLKKTCFWPLPGPLDYASGVKRQDDHLIPYNHTFYVAQNGNSGVASGKKEYYSFDHGDVHFICLDAYGEEQNKRLYDTTSVQAIWLKNDLLSNTKTWKVVCLAFPPYTRGTLNSDSDTVLVKIRENIVPILERLQVDLVISGGSISYERSYLLSGHYGNASTYKAYKHRLSSSNAKYDGSTNSCPYVKKSNASGKGTVYIVTGSSGKRGSAQPDYPYPAMAYSNVKKAGALLLNVKGNRLDAKWLKEDGVVADKFTFVKEVNDTVVIQLNSGQTGTLQAPWMGSWYWPHNASTSRTVSVAAPVTSFFSVRDSLNCLSRTFLINISGQSPAGPLLVFPPDSSCCNANPVSLKVHVSDPDANPVKVWFYGRKKPAMANPPAPFTVMDIPDTQFYTGETRGGQNNFFKAQMDWIVAHKDSLNIAFVAHMGDCVNNGDNGGNDIEWKRADTAMSVIEDPHTTSLPHGIPYGICVGNHDQSPNGDPNGSTTFYNQYFGTSRFSGRSYYGGHFGSNNDNHYELFSVDGYEFIFISLEYDENSNPAVLAWADDILKSFPNHIGIVSSHYLLNINGILGTQGQTTFDYLKANPNLKLFLCGHISGEKQRTDLFNGRKIYTLLSDYQSRLNGGTGWMNLLRFFPGENKLKVKTYTPVYDIYETDQNSEYELEMDLYPEFKLLGSVNNVTSGSVTAFNWAVSDTGTYEWYVRVSDGVDTVESAKWSFTVTTPSARILKNRSLESELKIVPNPAFDNLQIYTSIPWVIAPEIYSLDGKKIMVIPDSGVADISKLTQGTYLIRVLLQDGNLREAIFIKE